jgi:hypothetical protein
VAGPQSYTLATSRYCAMKKGKKNIMIKNRMPQAAKIMKELFISDKRRDPADLFEESIDRALIRGRKRGVTSEFMAGYLRLMATTIVALGKIKD